MNLDCRRTTQSHYIRGNEMEIRAVNVSDARQVRRHNALSFQEAELVRGDIEIEFVRDGEVQIYRRENIYVPIVAHEAIEFFDTLVTNHRATWRLFFAPFLSGRKEGNKFILYTGEGRNPQGGVVEVMTLDQIKSVQETLLKLRWRYGHLISTAAHGSKM